MKNDALVPLLVIRGAARAIDFYARVRDPFGYLWILRERREQLSLEEIQRQRDQLFAQGADLSRNLPPRTPHEDGTTVSHSEAALQARSAGSARVHLIVGPVGAGKSTFARKLGSEQSALRLTLDEWMSALFRPDRPDTGVLEWYSERASRCVEQIWSIARANLDLGLPVILEIGLLQTRERVRFCTRAKESGYPLTVYVLDADRDVRRGRVAERNRKRGATFSMVVPPSIFELASDLWEPPSPIECEDLDVHFIRTD